MSTAYGLPTCPSPRPRHSQHLDDARRHLEQAIASVRAAANDDPRTARAVSGVHAVLIDNLETLRDIP